MAAEQAKNMKAMAKRVTNRDVITGLTAVGKIEPSRHELLKPNRPARVNDAL
jgi:hypothetical protein